MLQVITGRFHPHLESALVDRIKEVKSGDPFASLAVVVPSAPLRDRIGRLLATEAGLSLLNVHLLTFHQLALRLADERSVSRPSSSIRIVDDLFFEQLIRRIVQRQIPSLAPLQRMGHASGAWGALWSTIRDLKDAGVDPGKALQGVREGYFGQDDSAWLDALFSLHAAVGEAGRTLNVGTADDLAESLVSLVPSSPFVASLRHVVYYGFYDLTQVQLDLFAAVSRTAPTTLLYPLAQDRAYTFARRFFERHIQPIAAAPQAVVHLADETVPCRADSVTVAVRSVIGADEELATVCRTILDLVETNGYRFDDIGVVARTLDPYRIALPAEFDRHRIPLVVHGGRPLIHEPVCKTLLQLASLPLNGYYRTAVLDIVTSPLSRCPFDEARSGSVRPDLWKLLVPALGITRGREEWSRLEQVRRSTVELELDGENAAGSGPLGIGSDVVDSLWQIVSRLLTDCESLPSQGPVSELIRAFRLLSDGHLRRYPAETSETDETAFRLTPVWEAIDRIVDSLNKLAPLGENLTWAEFVELLTHAIERATVRADQPEHAGVSVLDAMAARGLRFKALFVLGLNEKVFPRYIREDAFLRDRHRVVLDATLGFKIDEKLSGYDEEALLFALLGEAADRRLYLSFQRADDAGRTMAPSPYLEEVGGRVTAEAPPVEVVPRRLTDRVAQRPSIRMFLPPADLAVWLALSEQDPSELLKAIGRDAEAFRRGVETLGFIENEETVLTPYDGLTGTLAPHWARLRQRGFSPTPLERYARCPFQYFAADVLGLTPVRLPVSYGLDPVILGTLCHAALRYCYEGLLPTGWPAEPVTDDTIAWCIHGAVERAAAECEAGYRTGYSVLWDMAKEIAIALVSAAVESDEAAQADSPFVPIAFEVDAEGTLPDGITADGQPVKIHGRIDRVDRHRMSGELRIVDYKVKMGSHMQPEDRNLLQAAVRGTRLQPPFYASMAVPGRSAPTHVQFFFLAPNWETPVARSVFPAAVWSSEAGSLLRTTIATFLEGIRTGRFFIVPDGYCDTCDFRAACRREHSPSWWRASRAAERKTLKALRSLRVKGE